MALTMHDMDKISQMITNEADQTREVFMLEIRNVNRNVRELNTTIKSHNGRLREADIELIKMKEKIIDIAHNGKLHELQCPVKLRVDDLFKDKAVRIGKKELLISVLTVLALVLGAFWTSIRINEYYRTRQMETIYQAIENMEEKREQQQSEAAPVSPRGVNPIIRR